MHLPAALLCALLPFAGTPPERPCRELVKLPQSSYLGAAVATNGTYLAVGASNDSGPQLLVLERSFLGSWGSPFEIVPFPEDETDFGEVIAMHGDWLAVGSKYWDDPTFPNAGRVVLYHLEPTPTQSNRWVFGGALTSLFGPGPNTKFGSSVDIDEGRIAVGALGEGLAYVFRWDGSQWAGETILGSVEVSPSAAVAQYGHSIAVSGDRVLVGAPRDDHGLGGDDRGAVYPFQAPPGGGPPWTPQMKLVPDAGQSDGSLFGWSLDASQNRAIVGAPGSFLAPGPTGAAYVYKKSGLWEREERLSDNGNDQLGTEVAIGTFASFPFALTTAPTIDEARSFTRNGNGQWELSTIETCPACVSLEHFACSVAIGGGTAAIGGQGSFPAPSTVLLRSESCPPRGLLRHAGAPLPR